jgi:hypothetical protein
MDAEARSAAARDITATPALPATYCASASNVAARALGGPGKAPGLGDGQSEIEVKGVETHRKIRIHIPEFPYCAPIPGGVNCRA